MALILYAALDRLTNQKEKGNRIIMQDEGEFINHNNKKK